LGGRALEAVERPGGPASLSERIVVTCYAQGKALGIGSKWFRPEEATDPGASTASEAQLGRRWKSRLIIAADPLILRNRSDPFRRAELEPSGGAPKSVGLSVATNLLGRADDSE
jgi:hypothetical protein